MRRPPFFFGLLAALLCLPAARGQAQAPIELPKDPTAPVITLDYQDGRQRKCLGPHMVIRADGTVTVSDPYGSGKTVETSISMAEVRALLGFVVGQQRFFDFDEVKVKAAVTAEVKRTGGAFGAGGNSGVVLRIKTAAQDREIRYNGLHGHAKWLKDVKDLSRLNDVEQRLRRVMYVAMAGGPDEVAKHLMLVNERLKQDHPKTDPLTTNDFQYSRWRDLDTLEVQFLRATRPGESVYGIVSRPTRGDFKVETIVKVNR
jgi:hypothetical protein